MSNVYARGKKSKAICDRCGWKFYRKELLLELGTQLRVCSECHDGAFDRVNHPQNFAPQKLSDATALRWTRSDEPEEGIGYLVDYDDNIIGDITGDLVITK